MNHNEDNTYHNSKINDDRINDDDMHDDGNHDDEIDNYMHDDMDNDMDNDDIDFLDDLDLDNLNNDILSKSDCVCTDKRDASEITLKTVNDVSLVNEISKLDPNKDINVFGITHNDFLPNVDAMNKASTMESLTESQIYTLLEEDNNNDTFHIEDNHNINHGTRVSTNMDTGTDNRNDTTADTYASADVINTPLYTELDERKYISLIKDYILNYDSTDRTNYNYDEYQRKVLFANINVNTLKWFIKKINIDLIEPRLRHIKNKLVDATKILSKNVTRAIYYIIFGNKSLSLRYILKVGEVLHYIYDGLSRLSGNYTLEKPVKRMTKLYNDIIDTFNKKFN